MEGFCRGCLIKYEEPAELLEYTEKNRRLFVYSTGLQVKRNDTFTFQLCKDCYLNMKQACKFKKMCRTTDKKFKHFMSLKELGETTDLCTYLKNNDDNLTFRFPLLPGNSTPANQKNKDDDVESTCTSIGNFMTDLLQGEEMPDTEARIIRQVMQEEADVLDDSLDSHWLQDDVSIDTDFRLDFSFSPFSTPRSVNNDHCYTPKRFQDKTTEKYVYSLPQIETEPIRDNITNTNEESNRNNNNDLNEEISTNVNDINEVINKEMNDISQSNQVKSAQKQLANFYTDTLITGKGNVNNLSIEYENQEVFKDHEDEIMEAVHGIDNDLIIEQVNDNATTQDTNKNIFIENTFMESTVNDVGIDSSFFADDTKQDFQVQNTQCTIDKNLEEALKDDNVKEFSLDDLLTSPTVYPNAAAPSTPTIENILYGDRLDENSNSENKMGQCIEKFQNVEGDVDSLNDLFENSMYSFETLVKLKTNSPKCKDIANGENYDTNNYIIEDGDIMFIDKDERVIFGCKEMSSTNRYFDLIDCYCKLCKKKFETIKSLKIHSKKRHKITIKLPLAMYKRPPVQRICDYCGKKMTDMSNFVKHVYTHTKPKKFQCNRCSLTFTAKHIYDAHIKSHFDIDAYNVNKKFVCPVCGKKLSNSSNYNTHLRRHEKNYVAKCEECGKGFYRKTELTVHLREHTGERPFTCSQCKKSYKRRSHLIQHMKYHSGELKRYECDNCNRTFHRKILLIKHIQGEGSRRCFLRSAKKRGKKIIYEKNYKCFYCSARFVHKENLINHQKTYGPCVEAQNTAEENKNSTVRVETPFLYVNVPEEE